jgi:hypothetical protein
MVPANTINPDASVENIRRAFSYAREHRLI